MTSDSESDGVAREKERSAVIPAKRACSSRSKVPKKKAKKAKKTRRRCKESSSSSSSSDREGSRRRGGRGRSPSTTALSSSSGSGDSDWEAFYARDTVIKVRNMLKTAPPRAPRDVAKGRFAFDASGEVHYVKKAEKGKKEKWMRESRGDRSDLYREYKGSISRLGHSGNDRVLRRNFTACVQPLMAVEKVLTTVPMGSGIRRELQQARRTLADRLYLLEVVRETNPTVAAFVLILKPHVWVCLDVMFRYTVV
jgi:hypothetical protein